VFLTDEQGTFTPLAQPNVINLAEVSFTRQEWVRFNFLVIKLQNCSWKLKYDSQLRIEYDLRDDTYKSNFLIMLSGLLYHMARIALVDDDRNILTSVKMTLEGEGFEIDTYSDGQSALEAFYRKQPDIVVLDIKMPRMDGMDLLQKMRPKISSPVIFLTSKDDEIDEVLGLRMGADDYIKKPFSQRLLVARIRALLRRQAQFSDSLVVGEKGRHLLERGALTMDPMRHAVTWKDSEISLTVTEFVLLQALAQRPGFVKSRDQLMDVAYDDQIYVDDRTIDSHIKRLRKKMRAVDSQFSCIETLYGIGYRYSDHLA
jgi:two-component system response regulator ChvI|tara:strand:- start:68 stop:1012 length:945 start_codon:yes stop_codon:yes gene_type:complete